MAQGPEPAGLSIGRTGDRVQLAWSSSGVLQSATRVERPWMPVVGATSPIPVQTSGPWEFFRLAHTPNGRSIRAVVNPSNGHTYHLLAGTDDRSGISWTDAETVAVSLGGSLVAIDDAAEHEWVATTFSEAKYLWLGLHDSGSEGLFGWSNGQPIEHVAWYEGEPNDTARSEDHVLMYNFPDGFWRWNDYTDSPNVGDSPVYGLAEVTPPPVAASEPWILDEALTKGTQWGQESTIDIRPGGGPCPDRYRSGGKGLESV